MLKRLRQTGENGPQPLPLSEILLYLRQVLRYSDSDYIHWLTAVIMGCDQGEREVIQEQLKEKRDQITRAGRGKTPS